MRTLLLLDRPVDLRKDGELLAPPARSGRRQGWCGRFSRRNGSGRILGRSASSRRVRRGCPRAAGPRQSENRGAVLRPVGPVPARLSGPGSAELPQLDPFPVGLHADPAQDPCPGHANRFSWSG